MSSGKGSSGKSSGKSSSSSAGKSSSSKSSSSSRSSSSSSERSESSSRSSRGTSSSSSSSSSSSTSSRSGGGSWSKSREASEVSSFSSRGGFMDSNRQGIGGGLGVSSRRDGGGGVRSKSQTNAGQSDLPRENTPEIKASYEASKTGLFDSGEVSPQAFREKYAQAMRTGFDKIYSKTAGNVIGGTLVGAFPGVGNKAVDAAIGFAGANAGGILGALSQKEMSAEDKAIQDYVDNQLQEEYDKAAWDSWTDYLRAGLRIGGAVLTGGASELGAGMLNSAIDRQQGLDRIAEKYGHIGGIAEAHEKNKAAVAQAQRDRDAQRQRDGDYGGKAQKIDGILPTMQAQAGGLPLGGQQGQGGSGVSKNPFSYDLSSLNGLWDNLKVV